MPALLTEPAVTAIPAAAPQIALAHFERLLTLETDCWDVHAAVEADAYVLLRLRSMFSKPSRCLTIHLFVPHRT